MYNGQLIQVKNYSCYIGKKATQALALVKSGATKKEVLEKLSVTLACQDLNFSVNQGEVFVVMGPSGCGKSSLLRSLNGLSANQENCLVSGEIHVWSEVKKSYLSPLHLEKTRSELQKNSFAFVFQSPCLLNWRNILDNVAFPLELKGVPKKERYERCDKILETVKLKEWTYRYPKDLSGGMKQRVGLARALVTESPILLMDEPFSALDPYIRSQLQNELLKLQEEFGKTIVFVTHDEIEAKKIGTRIALMNEGKIESIIPIVSSPSQLDFVGRSRTK